MLKYKLPIIIPKFIYTNTIKIAPLIISKSLFPAQFYQSFSLRQPARLIPISPTQIRHFSWKNPKPEETLRRAKRGKVKKFKLKPIRSLTRRFFWDPTKRLLKYRSPRFKHKRRRMSESELMKLKEWQYCTKHQTRKMIRFMKI